MAAPALVVELVEKFRRNRATYARGAMNETQLRQEFLDPFFGALGWDMANKQGWAPSLQEVSYEYGQEVRGSSKRADYIFRVGAQAKFFVEAKKPFVRLRTDAAAAYQLRSYAYSAKLALSILTDFEEFAVYDGRILPKEKDDATVARVLYVTFEEYEKRWDELAGVFGREAVWQGAFDEFAGTPPRAYLPVDKNFLKDMEAWRKLLATNIANRNKDKGLEARDLNFAVQAILDRVIFLRVCEDRALEAEGRLKNAAAGEDVYERLCELFREADARYNSGLFHFKKEKDRATPVDALTPGLAVDDKVLKQIIKDLYAGPYVFSVIPADILGQVYEQFLGKVIRVLPAGGAKVEDKPEVKKAGGVYYTPTYIVDYIVANTVGELLKKCQTPADAAKLRILDPACGSGSFLLGAYQRLLDWHQDWYVKDGAEKHARDGGGGAQGLAPLQADASAGAVVYRLTAAEKKRILLNNIYGVDIDPQAVEVTKLSLLLKALEDESAASLNAQQQLYKERALPDLGANVKCGNSLIGPDYFDGKLDFDEEERERVNPFDWEKAFPAVFTAGGFDAVIGNPPYIRSITLKEVAPFVWGIYREKYRSASQKEWDIYLVFAEKGLTLINRKGVIGFIVPNKLVNSQVGENLRRIISEGKHLKKLIHFGAFQIFEGATNYTCLLFLTALPCELPEIARFEGDVHKKAIRCPLPDEEPSSWVLSVKNAMDFVSGPWAISPSKKTKLFQKRKCDELITLADVFKGTGTNADKVFCLRLIERSQRLIKALSRATNGEVKLESPFIKPVYRGRDIARYEIKDSGSLLLLPYEEKGGKYTLIAETELKRVAPRVYSYLKLCKTALDQREKGRFKGAGWFCFGRPQNLDRFDKGIKIICPDVVDRGSCYLDEDGYWLLDTAYAIVSKTNVQVDIRFLLGVLNSPLLTYFLKETGTPLRGGYFRMKTAYLAPFPIPHIDFNDAADVARHDKMVSLVERMLDLHKKKAAAKTPPALARLESEIQATDAAIDKLVYELYGLTEEEIKIVES